MSPKTAPAKSRPPAPDEPEPTSEAMHADAEADACPEHWFPEQLPLAEAITVMLRALFRSLMQFCRWFPVST
jgi:hypothetical protein